MAKYLLKIVLDETLDENITKYYKNYKSNYVGDSGIDLMCPLKISCDLFKCTTINFGIRCEMIEISTNKQVSYYLYPRSSFSSTPLIMANHVGIIDSGYRGNILAKVKHIPTNLESHLSTDSNNIHFTLPVLTSEYYIEAEHKLFQICGPDLGIIKLLIVDELNQSDRAENGFGSTGF